MPDMLGPEGEGELPDTRALTSSAFAQPFLSGGTKLIIKGLLTPWLRLSPPNLVISRPSLSFPDIVSAFPIPRVFLFPHRAPAVSVSFVAERSQGVHVPESAID